MPTATRTADALMSSLAAQQRRVRGIVEGLDDQTLQRPVLPSGWTCAGMIHHLTSSTRFWFVEVMAGLPGAAPVEDDFLVPADLPVSTLVDAYEEEARRCAALVADMALDTPPAWWPGDLWGPWRLDTLEEVLLHVLVETTTHAGHLDAGRELIDGRTWDYEHGRLTDAG